MGDGPVGGRYTGTDGKPHDADGNRLYEKKQRKQRKKKAAAAAPEPPAEEPAGE